jgi:hypothetical protein
MPDQQSTEGPQPGNKLPTTPILHWSFKRVRAAGSIRLEHKPAATGIKPDAVLASRDR